MPKVEQWIEEQIESWQPVISSMLEGAEQSAVSAA